MSSHKDFAVVPEGVEGVDLAHPLRSGARVLDGEAGIVERRREKLAIVGYATSSRDMAPFNDPEWEIVGLNQLYRFIPRADFWCDIHENWNEENVEGTDHEAWLRDCGMPILMFATQPQLPTSVKFPLHDIIAKHGIDYFTSTISYLIAWGIYQGYKTLGLFGIDLIVGTEYEVQKACAEAWLLYAHGRDIQIVLPPNCALLKHTHRYGYEREPAAHPIRLSDYGTRIERLTKERDSHLARLHALDGAIHEAIAAAGLFGVSTAESAVVVFDESKRAEREKWLRQQHQETVATLATIDGALQESIHWKELATLRSRGADVRMR